MADKKISALTALRASPASGDYIPIVDISESLDVNKNKYVTPSDLHMPVFLTTPLNSTAWDGDARSTTAKTLIDLSAVFGVPAGISAVLVRVMARDSGSASGGAQFALAPNDTDASHTLFLNLSYGTNDITRSISGIVPCDTNGDIYFQCVGTGVGTLDVWLEIWGYWL
jgi:hypothetical protein